MFSLEREKSFPILDSFAQGHLLILHGPSLPASSALISARNGDASLG